jgi:hypothetical protein
MKIVITESHLRSLVRGMKGKRYQEAEPEQEIPENVNGSRPYTPEQLMQRRMYIIQQGNKYASPNEFMKKDRTNWAAARTHKLLDVIYPGRKKYNPDLNPNEVERIANQYGRVSDFANGHPVAYNYAFRNGMLKDLFPRNNAYKRFDYEKSGYDDPNMQKHLDNITHAAAHYGDMETLGKKNPPLYKQMYDLGHEFLPDDAYDDEEGY